MLAQQAEQDRLDKARRVAERFGLPIRTSPVAAIQDEIDRCNGLVSFYGAKVAELSDQQMVFGVAKVEDIRAGQGRPGRNTTAESGINTWITLWNLERDRLAKLSVEAAKIGIAAMQVQLDQQRTQAIVSLIDATLVELGVDPSDKAVSAVVARHALQLLPGPS